MGGWSCVARFLYMVDRRTLARFVALGIKHCWHALHGWVSADLWLVLAAGRLGCYGSLEWGGCLSCTGSLVQIGRLVSYGSLALVGDFS